MKSQLFTHENEILAMAPLGEDDRNLFSKQEFGLLEETKYNGISFFKTGRIITLGRKLAYSEMN
ncbi:hypothetical protein A0V53_22770 [Salmonella enterica]|nr:hypothetical protein [Salmonella enterica]EAW0958065.1 hypothetical protein [Salmonella enterica]